MSTTERGSHKFGEETFPINDLTSAEREQKERLHQRTVDAARNDSVLPATEDHMIRERAPMGRIDRR